MKINKHLYARVLATLVFVLSPSGRVWADNLRADQWQPLLYEPLSRQRAATANITITFPEPAAYAHAMRDDDYGAREFSDAPNGGGLSVDTRHSTSLGPHTISVFLHALASQDPSQAPPELQAVGTASSTSTINYTFRLMKDSNVRLTAATWSEVSGGGSSTASLQLEGPGGMVVSLSGDGETGEQFRTLTAGQYTLRAIASAQNGGQPHPSIMRSALAVVDFELRQWPDFSPVEFLDPVRSGWVTFNDAARTAVIDAVPPTRFWAGGVTPTGVAADGVTPLLVRWRPESWAELVTLSLPGFPSGQLVSVDEWNDGPPYEQDDVFPAVVYESVNLPGYQHANRYVYAVYVPPISFGEGGHGEYGRQMPRLTSVTGQGWLSGVPGQQETTVLPIYRPPVVLLHGLEDKPASWRWSLVTDERFHVHPADYEETHDRRFATNIFEVQVLSKAVKRAKDMLLDEGIAVSQVDIFGHSMGGLLARMWTVADNMYVRKENLYRGDFHTLTTVNTPHRGSPVSCLVVDQHGSLTAYGDSFGFIADLIDDRCTPCGAVADLRPDSHALLNLNSAIPSVPVPVHAMFGIGGHQTPEHEYTRRTVRWIIGWCSSLTLQSFFESAEDPAGDNDAIVSKVSQIHGLPPECTSQFELAEGLHYPVINEVTDGTPNTWAGVLLNSNVTDGDGKIVPPFANSFPRYPVRGACSPATIACSQRTFTQGGIAFISPVQGRRVDAGGTISISLTFANPPPNPYVLVLSANGRRWHEIHHFVSPANPFHIQVPDDLFGLLTLTAVVESPGGYSASGSVWVHVVPPAPPIALRAHPSSLRLSQDARRDSVRVLGSFPDGVERDVTALVVLRSKDDATAMVNENGSVEARRVGATTVVASWDGLETPISIAVESAPGDWNSDAVIDFVDAHAFGTSFTGPSGAPDYAPPLAPAQFAFDFDGDNDVDCDDWLEFTRRWTGPGTPPQFGECPNCPADFDMNGQVNSADFFAYITEFFNESLAADFDRNGIVNSQDFFDFLAAFFVAC